MKYPARNLHTNAVSEIYIYIYYSIYKTTRFEYCLTQWISKLLGSSEIHWVRHYLVNFTFWVGIVNATVYKTKPFFTGLGFGKLSYFTSAVNYQSTSKLRLMLCFFSGKHCQNGFQSSPIVDRRLINCGIMMPYVDMNMVQNLFPNATAPSQLPDIFFNQYANYFICMDSS